MTDPYEAVLLDLRAKRDQIDQTISLLTAMRSGVSVASDIMATPSNDTNTPDAGAFLGMSIVDAAKKLLAARKRAMPNAEIYAELKAGGLVLTGADPVNVVSSVLTRRFNQIGDVVRVSRGTWGLKEWYPNRNFKSADKSAAAPVATQGNGFEVQINDLGEDEFEGLGEGFGS